MLIRLTLLALTLFIGLPLSSEAEEARLLRFPAIHGNQVAFTYAGNLYTVAAEGGLARRLTHHDGFEMFPRFSPDGKWLAFTGQYDGNTEVYVMPAGGGIPKRLTFTATLSRDEISDRMGPNNVVMTWTPDGKKIVFRSRMHTFNDFVGSLYAVDVQGGLPEPLPLPRGGFCSYSPDGSKLAYNQIFREFRTWKRYRGGMCDEVWVHDFATKKTERITNDPAQDIFPMWHGKKIYFLSDRDKDVRFNLYSYDTDSKQTKKLTTFTDFDIKFPSLGDKAIVFENGGFIYKFDLATEKATKLAVTLQEDFLGGRGGLTDVSKRVTTVDISPDGKRALFGARGEIFTVPEKNGITRNLTQTSGVHERNASWSPNGKWIAFVSDATGEDEIYVVSPMGGQPMQLTSGSDNYKYEFAWSPDSTKIAWSDRKQRLRYVDVASKEVKEVFQSPVFEMRSFVWSPDSRWIAYTRPEEEGFPKVYLYSLESGQNTAVTDGWYRASQPCFSGDGKYLFFVSDRDFNPIYSQTEWNHAYQNMQRIYFVTLAKGTANPFAPKNDEAAMPKEEKPAADAAKGEEKPDDKAPPKKDEPKKDETKKDDKPQPKPITVDLDGLMGRVMSLPVPPAQYFALRSIGGAVYYQRVTAGAGGPGMGGPRGAGLYVFDLAAPAPKETSLGNLSGYEISADGKKMIIVREGSYSIVDLPRGPLPERTEPLNLSGLQVRLDRRAEWKQIYHECWRQMRDFFYVENLHGVDWPAMRKKYEPLVAHVNHRADLSYIIGELIAELNCGHAYVGGGELPEVKRIPLGLLGARYQKTDQGFKITRILPGENWDRRERSPLTELGVEVKVGDVITAIDGQPTKELGDLHELLIGTAGKQVILTLDAGNGKTRDVTVIPIADESNLLYREWVKTNLAKVEKATDGKVGYLHVPDMQVTGLNEFARQFYPQLQKKALIIDMRGNGGGNVSPMLIERLRRQMTMISISRNSIPRTSPAEMLAGPMCCLLNEYSASDGDLFPYQFKQHKLGKLIGRRSWGGVVGIRGTLPLLDGGSLNRPEFSRYDLEGKTWVIEGYGVDPDIVVENDPAEELAGKDRQLEKAIEHMLEELKTKEFKMPPPPPGPKK